MMLKRVMGKASFRHPAGRHGPHPVLSRREDAGEGARGIKHWDLGDIIAARGVVFKTRNGELSVRVRRLRLLTKTLRPLPDKFHGIADQELRYRQRYVDLIMTDERARASSGRSKAMSAIRHFMVEHGFLEVETPMLHPIPGGATPSRSSPTTTRSTSRCSCASRPSCT